MPLKPLFQNQTPFILLSPVFQRIFNSPGQNQQNGKRASASYHLNPSRLHLNPSGLIIRLYPLIFLQSLSALSLSIIFVELCIKTISHYDWGTISNLRCSSYWKMYFASQEIESWHSYSCSQGKTIPQVIIIIVNVERNYSFPLPMQRFFKISFSSHGKRKGEKTMKVP